MSSLSGKNAGFEPNMFDSNFVSTTTLTNAFVSTTKEPLLWMPVLGVILTTIGLVILSLQLWRTRRELEMTRVMLQDRTRRFDNIDSAIGDLSDKANSINAMHQKIFELEATIKKRPQ
jgi:hypothetical protein